MPGWEANNALAVTHHSDSEYVPQRSRSKHFHRIALQCISELAIDLQQLYDTQAYSGKVVRVHHGGIGEEIALQ